MSFVSFTFAAFFVGVLAVRFVLDRFDARGAWVAMLVATSLVFYAWNVPWHVLLLLGLAVVGYTAGRAIDAARAGRPTARRAVAAAVVAGLGLLAFFKYFDYLALGVANLETAVGFPGARPLHLGLVLPLGISFYTFEMVSYAVDVDRGRLEPARRFGHFLLFLSFFPHLVAGPIVRAGDFLYQIDRRRRPRLRVMSEGVYLVIRGLFLKVVVADNLAPIVDYHWTRAAVPGAGASLAALVTVLFAFQILCDFDGYSTIARGAAYLLGFRLPLNFDSPYIAGTFREFWQRWHITLSRWLRDYLYVPLGGNRVGPVRLHVNLLLVMVLGGLWHGAANTFLVWGAVHGTALVVERVLGFQTLSERGPAIARILWWVVVQATVLVAWVFFRSSTTAEATALVGNVMTGRFGALDPGMPLGRLAALLAVPIAEHVRAAAAARFGLSGPSPNQKAVWAAVMLYAVCTAYGPSKTFIYFQF